MGDVAVSNGPTKLHLIFIDSEKACDKMHRKILWKVLEKKGVRIAYIQTIQDMYEGYRLVCGHMVERRMIFSFQ